MKLKPHENKNGSTKYYVPIMKKSDLMRKNQNKFIYVMCSSYLKTYMSLIAKVRPLKGS